MTKYLVILSAEHERIRIPLEKERIATAVTRLRNDGGGKTDCHTPYGVAMTKDVF